MTTMNKLYLQKQNQILAERKHVEYNEIKVRQEVEKLSDELDITL